jgi:hypothetical protein
MLDLTPKTHQDYLSTLSLSRSTDIALKVMTEVKAREDEYNLLKRVFFTDTGFAYPEPLGDPGPKAFAFWTPSACDFQPS